MRYLSGLANRQHRRMRPSIRPLQHQDRGPVIALSLQSWAPVFASLENILGPSGIYAQLHPDWRSSQQSVVATALDSQDISVWVATVDGEVAGFVAVQLEPEHSIGHIYLLAVDPDHQRRGLGAALTSFAVQQIKDSGMTLAMVETGGDPGHGPARRTYQSQGFTPLPVTRYFQALS